MAQPIRPAVETQRFGDLVYRRAAKDRGSEPRGTLWLPESGESGPTRVPGFPPIRRVYRLKAGVKRLFGRHTFVGEEKLDGYNARLFRHGERVLAATRGGFLCPFTTEWAEIWAEDTGIGRFLEEHPERVLCGEVLGDDPYNHQREPGLPAGAHFRVFDIAEPDGRFLPPDERHALAGQYDLPHVPVAGHFSARRLEDLYDTLRELNERRREGLVMKSLDAERLMKFVTPESDCADIRDSFNVAFDLPAGFFQNRLYRASMAVDELCLDRDAYAHRLGAAFIEGCPRAGPYRESSRSCVIYVRSQDTWERLYGQLAGQVRIELDAIDTAEVAGREMHRVAFRRVYDRSTHRFRRMLRGHLSTD
jgi:putative ATP-dependent DNA ligase